MDDIYGKVEAFPNHFQDPKASENCLDTRIRTDYSLRSGGHLSAVRRVMGAASILNLFSLSRLPWVSYSNDDDKVELTRAEVEALLSEIADAEERETYLKAQLSTIHPTTVSATRPITENQRYYTPYLFMIQHSNVLSRLQNQSAVIEVFCISRCEHLDEILKSARLSGYLYTRNRWTELPGEPPILDDADVDDWLPRFVVLNGSCIFYYLKSTDLSPQDSTLLSDVVEVGPLPNFTQDDDCQQRYAFYILTCHGLRFECSSLSEVQVDSWLTALRVDCKLDKDPMLH